MTLPASFVEAEAIGYAREFLAQMQAGEFCELGSAPLDRAAGHALARRWCRLCIEFNPQSADQVVELAVKYGELAAHEALVEIIDEKTDRNEPLGAVLGAYSIRLRRIPFRAHSGPSRSTLPQDIVFTLLMIELVERFGLRPTRNRDRKHDRPSACGVVATVAAELGLGRGTEDAFRKIWDRAAPRILPGYRIKSAKALAILQRYGAVAA